MILAKSARVTFFGAKFASNLAQISSDRTLTLLPNRQLLAPIKFQCEKWRFFHSDSVKWMSNSLAEDILNAKQAEKLKNEESDSEKKGPKQMSKWQKIGYIFFGVFTTGMMVINAILFSLPDRDENGNVIKDEFSERSFPSQNYQRLKNRIFKTKKDLEEPFSDRLLPDTLPEPYIQPKYTVVVEITGFLVHANWMHKHGWRFQKRPGVDLFMSQIGYPNFELVVYSVETPTTFFPIVDGLDPGGQYINYRLFRDATRFVNGHPTKDISALNRDPKRVIMIDWNKDSVALGLDNSLILEKWEGDNSDRSLIGLAQLLQAIKESDVDDVREVLTYYRQFDNPIEAFRENQRRLQDEIAENEEKLRKKNETGPTGLLSGMSLLRRR